MPSSDIEAMKFYKLQEVYSIEELQIPGNPIGKLLALHEPFFTHIVGTDRDETGFVACKNCLAQELDQDAKPVEFPCPTMKVLLTYFYVEELA